MDVLVSYLTNAKILKAGIQVLQTLNDFLNFFFLQGPIAQNTGSDQAIGLSCICMTSTLAAGIHFSEEFFSISKTFEKTCYFLKSAISNA